MNKLKNFWRVFTKSIGSISYYKDVARAKFSFSLKYLYFLLFLIALLSGIVSAVKLSYLIPKIPEYKESIKSQALNFYPKELIVTIKNQKITTNVTEPYFVGSFAVIDTKIAPADFSKFPNKAIVGDSFIAVPDSSGNEGYRLISLTDYLKNVPNNTQFNQKDYLAVVNKLLPYLNYLPTIAYYLIAIALFVLPFLVAGFTLLGRMFTLLFSSLALLILAKIMKRDLNYGKIYQLSLHALTIPVVLTFVSVYFVFPVAWLNTVIFLAYMILVIDSWEIRESHTPGV